MFARQDYVEEAWRIVDPVLKQETRVYPYEPKTWGPKEVDHQLALPGGGTIQLLRFRKNSRWKREPREFLLRKNQIMELEVVDAEASGTRREPRHFAGFGKVAAR